MTVFMGNENRLRVIRDRMDAIRDEVRQAEAAGQAKVAAAPEPSLRAYDALRADIGSAMSADYVEMHDLRPLTPVKRDWRGPGQIWKAAAFCAAGSVAFAILVLFSLHALYPGAF